MGFGTWRAGIVNASALLPLCTAASIWEVGRPQGHIETRTDFPDPLSFFNDYVHVKEGSYQDVGRPVLFKGAARRMPAYGLWSDKYLREKHGSVQLDQVETEKRETRTRFPHEGWTLAKFLAYYNDSEIYSTAETPVGLSDEVALLPPVNCGGFTKHLQQTVFWMSSGGTRSVVHNDGGHNFHCMFDGVKRWILWSPKSPIPSREFGWVDGEKEAKTNPDFKDAYGSYVGLVDLDSVDLERFPGWDTLDWWSLTLEAGDCAFIPSRWYHLVEAPVGRSISVHVWFYAPKAFDRSSCEELESRGWNLTDYLIKISDCTWGYEGPGSARTECQPPQRQQQFKGPSVKEEF